MTAEFLLTGYDAKRCQRCIHKDHDPTTSGGFRWFIRADTCPAALCPWFEAALGWGMPLSPR
jgi:hypothetical protein